MKRLRALLLATAFMVAAPGAAQADPISLSVGLLAGALSYGAGASAWIAVGVGALTAGLSYLQKSLIPHPKNNPASSSGSTTIGNIVPQAFPIGNFGIDGTLAYINTYGTDGSTPNALLVQVIALSDLPVGALTGMICNGKNCTLGNTTISNPKPELGTPVPEFYQPGPGRINLWYKFYDGTQTEADSFLVSQFGADDYHPYSSNRIGTGRAYVIVTARVNAIFQGRPTLRFVTSGIKLYDPRKDTSAGGSGGQDWNDSSTWEVSNNPQLMRYNVRRGIYYGRTADATGQWMFGGQNLPAFRLPFDNWTAAMTECDTSVDNVADTYSGTCTISVAGSGASRVATITLVDESDATDPYGFSLLTSGSIIKTASGYGTVSTNTGSVIITSAGWTGTYSYGEPVAWTGTTPAGGTEAQYRAGGEIKCDEEPANLDESLIRACNARAIDLGGIAKTTTGAAGSAVFTFTDADILITEAQDNQQYAGLANLVNGVTARFPNPDTWEQMDAPALYDSTLQTEDDDQQQLANISYDAVPYIEQVQRLMKASLQESRQWRTHTIVLSHEFWRIEPGDIGAWTSDVNGYSSKLFRVESRGFAPNRQVSIVIKEVDPADYDWVSADDFQPVPIGSTAPIDVAAQVMSGWDAEPVTVDGDNGMAMPGIQLSWDTADIDDVASVGWAVRLTSDSSMVASGNVENWTTGSVNIAGLFLPNTAYQAQGHYIPPDGSLRDTDWSDWLDVTTDDVGITTPQIADGAVTGDKIADATIDATKFASSVVFTGVGDTLPDPSGYTGPLLFFDTTDGQLYRYVSGAWTLAVPTVNLTGTITADQIAAGTIDVSKLASDLTFVQVLDTAPVDGTGTEGDVVSYDGQLYVYTSGAWTTDVPAADITGTIVSSQIADAAVTTAKFASGISVPTLVDTLPGSGTAGDLVVLSTDGQLYRYASGAWTAAVPTSGLTGTISTSQVAANAITAAKIASATITGTLIASGTITGSLIAGTTIAGSNIIGSTITGTQVAAATIAAANIVSGTITATQVAASTITGAKIAAATITASNLVANTITAAVVAAGAIGTTQLAANAITASKLLLTDLTNMVKNPNFSDSSGSPSSDGWSIYSGASLVAGSSVGSPAVGVAEIPYGGGIYTNGPFTAAPGQSFVISFDCKVSAGCTVDFVFNEYDISGTYVGYGIAGATATTAWVNYSATYTTSTAGARSAQLVSISPASSGYTAYVTNVVIRKAASAELLVDGSITALFIAASTITGAKIAAATITASNLVANTITAAVIASGTITGSLIAGGTITAANILSLTITGAQIAAATITASNLVANTITAGQIASATITGTLIVADTIDATHIVSGSLTQLTASAAGNATAVGNAFSNSTVYPGASGNVNTTTLTEVASLTVSSLDTNSTILALFSINLQGGSGAAVWQAELSIDAYNYTTWTGIFVNVPPGSSGYYGNYQVVLPVTVAINVNGVPSSVTLSFWIAKYASGNNEIYYENAIVAALTGH